MQHSEVLSRLNAATRQWHAAADDPWLGLLRADTRRADYVAQLVRTYGFVAPFESACKYTPNLGRVLHFHHISRASLIARDLLALGLSPAQVATIPQCDTITTFRDVPEALGWLYVFERATLLHDGLRRRLITQMPDVADACSYLGAYDGNVGDHWDAFGRTLDRVCARPEAATAVIAAATHAFDCVKRWFRRSGSESRRSAG